MAPLVLICDDQEIIHETLGVYLESEGFSYISAYNGDEALQRAAADKPDLILLDIMMPGKSGTEVCREIRKTSHVPIIMLTAKGEEIDRILGLELGADDYIAKPFDSNELVARIKAVLRRLAPPDEPFKAVELPDLYISLENYSVLLDGEPIDMPPKEIELLYFLASHSGKVFTREQLLEQVWGFDFFGDSRTVDVHVKRIREKLGERDTWQLKTVWGVGYKFDIKQ